MSAGFIYLVIFCKVNPFVFVFLGSGNLKWQSLSFFRKDSVMKNLQLFFLLSLLVFVMSANTANADHLAGDLKISGPPGVKVWLNNEFKGETTLLYHGLYLENLSEGFYTIKAESPDNQILLDSFFLTSDRITELTLDFTPPETMVMEDIVQRKKITAPGAGGVLILRSIPLSARIFLDGQEVGLADIIIRNVPATEHKVRFVFQGKELAFAFTLTTGEELTLKANFKKDRIIKQSNRDKIDFGPEKMLLSAAHSRKPARFPHKEHQKKIECAECHHTKDAQGHQLPYFDGMMIQRCATCHNKDNMPNSKLSSFKLVAHYSCKGCHKRLSEAEKAGPISDCIGCHMK